MAVSRRLRFEILRRDGHTCRYCGATAPDAKLTVDHVTPIALGGSDEPSNLVTACADCNGGKTSIAPDAATIADVSADAIRWSDAMQRAASEREAKYAESAATVDEFRRTWNQWTLDGRQLELPVAFGASIRQMLAAGLTLTDFEELIEVAMSVETVRGADAKWRYFCGCCWTRVKQAHSRARELLEGAPPHGEHGQDEYDWKAEYWGLDEVVGSWTAIARQWRAVYGRELPPCFCLEAEARCDQPGCVVAVTELARAVLRGASYAQGAVQQLVFSSFPRSAMTPMTPETLAPVWAAEDEADDIYIEWKMGLR
ncbi:HNH endonuclease [Nocardia elegans]|uniref:HNH endonuclease n=1 Tax=Nocardia elegans TaxID=300029 RepID=A0ABW6TLB2_9NOCA